MSKGLKLKDIHCDATVHTWLYDDRNECCLLKDMCKNVCRSFIHRTPKPETTQMSSDSKKLCSSYEILADILLSKRKESLKDSILYDSTYIKFKNRSTLMYDGRSENGGYRLKGQEGAHRVPALPSILIWVVVTWAYACTKIYH